MHLMETNLQIPTLEELNLKWEEHNKKFSSNDEPNMVGFQQIIDVLKYSDKFHKYIYNNGYYSNIYLSYIIYAWIVHYMKYCYDNWDYREIRKMLEFVDEKMKSENEYISTLAQVWVLEILDGYPDMLDKVLELMPKYSKKVFLKYYSNYLNLPKKLDIKNT